jgi:hypothetical protein
VLRISAQVSGVPDRPFVPAFVDAMAGQFRGPLAAVDFADSERARPPPRPTGACPRPGRHTDRPFLFLIREKATNTVLFLGRVMDPSAS